MSEEPPAKRSKNVSRACDACRTGKRRCDGRQPCGNCRHLDKSCAYTMGDRRRRLTTPLPHSLGAEPSSASAAPALPTPPALAPPIYPPVPPIASFQSPSLPGPRAVRGRSRPRHEDDPSPRTAADDAMLASLTRAMANEPAPVSTPSDAHDAIKPGDVDASDHSTGFLASIHRHLSAVFSLRAQAPGPVHDHDVLAPDKSIASFFLPSKEEGMAYVRCYFDHAASTYRTRTSSRIQKGTALLLAVMATGCLWMPSWTGKDPNEMTPRAVKLYHASQRLIAQIPQFPARLSLIRIHLTTTHFLLGLSRFQTAYLSFRTAGRLALMLGLHRHDQGLPPPERERRRRVFWSSFMMDRYISAVLGLPVLYDELDITQSYFAVPDNATLRADIAQQNRVLIGSLAHIKLTRILGHAIRLLGSPTEVTPIDRASRIATVEAELAQWSHDSPAFFQPSPTGRDGLDEPQRRRCHAAYHFIKLITFRTYILDELLSRLRGTSTSASSAPSTEVQQCVSAAVQIAETAITMQDQSSYSGVLWTTAYFTFTALTVLFVYLILYLDAPDRAQVESVISRAQKANKRFSAGRGEQEAIFRESRRIASILRPPAAAGVSPPVVVGPSTMANQTADTPATEPLAALGDNQAGATTIADDWEALLRMVQAGFDVMSEGAYAAGALPSLDGPGVAGEMGGGTFDWGTGDGL